MIRVKKNGRSTGIFQVLVVHIVRKKYRKQARTNLRVQIANTHGAYKRTIRKTERYVINVEAVCGGKPRKITHPNPYVLRKDRRRGRGKRENEIELI